MRHIFTILLISLSFICHFVNSEDQWMFQSEKQWDKEWKSGAWTYLEKVAVERSRIAIIGGVFIPMYSGNASSVLDIGCGEGAISDFLNPIQRAKYVGVDISKEAISVAKLTRGSPRKFVHAAAHLFSPMHKFDVIIFSDMLYYVEHEKILKQYSNYMNPNAIVIISIFHQTEKLMYEHIFNFARNLFVLIDEIDVGGYTIKKKGGSKEKTAFHVEVYGQRLS